MEGAFSLQIGKWDVVAGEDLNSKGHARLSFENFGRVLGSVLFVWIRGGRCEKRNMEFDLYLSVAFHL